MAKPFSKRADEIVSKDKLDGEFFHSKNPLIVKSAEITDRNRVELKLLDGSRSGRTVELTRDWEVQLDTPLERSSREFSPDFCL